jgi:hypothetical protein
MIVVMGVDGCVKVDGGLRKAMMAAVPELMALETAVDSGVSF